MAVTRIKNNQITDLTITNAKLANNNITGGKLSDDLVYGSNLTVSGNLIVNGTTSTVDTTNTVVSDPLIVLSKNATGTASVDSGFVVERGTDQNVAFMWDESADEFAAVFTTEVGTTAGDVAIAGYANIHMAAISTTTGQFGNISISGNTIASTDLNGDIIMSPDGTGSVVIDAASITGGTIDGTVIGGTTPAAGTFTTLTSTGAATLASASVTGNAVVSGSLSAGASTLDSATITNNATVGGTMQVTGNTTLSTVSTSGLATLDSASITNNATVGGTLTATGLATFTAGADMTGDKIVNVATPTAGTDAANKSYVDAQLAAGFTLSDGTNNATISKGDTLTVSGTTNEIEVLASSGTGLSDTLTIGLPDDVTIGNDLTIVGTTSGANGVFTGTLQVQGTTTAAAINASSLTTSGAASVGTTLGVTGNTTLSTVTSTGAATLNSASITNNATVGGLLNVAGDFSVATNKFTVDSATGNTAVAGTFDVTGNTGLTGTLDVTGTTTLAAVSATSITDSGLTAGRLVYAGTGGVLTNSSNLAFNSGSGALTVTGSMQVDNININGNTISSTDAGGNIVLSPNGAGYIDAASSLISNVTNPVSAQDAATKAYVDAQISSGWTLTDGSTSQVVSGGDTVTLQGTTNEIEVAVTATGTMTIGLPDNVTVANNLTIGGGATVGTNLVVTGNLTVQGTTTTVNSTTTTVADPIYSIGTGASAPTADDGKDRGIAFDWYDTAARIGYFGYDNSTGRFTFVPNATISSEVVSGAKGGADFSAISVSGLTDNQLVYTTTGGELSTSSNLTFDGTNWALTGIGTVTGQMSVDNVTINGNAITSTNLNGNIELTPAGTGSVVISKIDANGGAIDGTVIGGTTPAAGTFTTLASTGAATLASASVTGNATVGGTLGVTGATTLGDTLSVSGAAQFDSTANIDGNLSVATNQFTVSAVDGSTAIAGTLTVSNDTSVTGDFSVNGMTTLTGQTTVIGGGMIYFNIGPDIFSTVFQVDTTTGTVTTSGDVSASGNVSGATLSSTGNASIGGTLTVTGTSTLAGVNAGATSVSTLSTSGNASIGGTLTATGLATFTAGADMTGDRILNVATPVAGTDAVNKSYVDGLLSSSWTVSDGVNTSTISGSDTLTVNGTAGEVTVAVGAGTDSLTIGLPDNVSITGTLATGSNATIGGTLGVTGNTTLGGTLNSGAATLASASVTGNATVGGTLDVTGDVTGADATFTSVTDSSLGATRVVFAGTAGILSDSANFTFTSGTSTLTVNGAVAVDNVRIDGNDLTVAAGTELTVNDAAADVNFRVEGTTDANVLFVDAGNDNIGIKTSTPNAEAALHINSTDSIIVPVGTTAQRPATPVTGMYRFNSTTGSQEIYDGTQWTGGVDFTVIASESFTGDDTTVAFTLASPSTTAASIVSVNGVVQLPTVAYGISGTTLTFTEAPAVGDVIEVRTLTTTTTVTGLSGNGGTIDTSQSGLISVTGNIIPASDNTYDIGSTTAAYANVYATNFIGTSSSANFGDLAENYVADAAYEPGTVVGFGGVNEVTAMIDDGSTRQAGIVSTNPAYLMNKDCEGEHVVAVAFTGRVPCKVKGTVAKGDMMVAAGNGYARAEAHPAVGSVIGKALESFNGDEGVIEVVVGR